MWCNKMKSGQVVEWSRVEWSRVEWNQVSEASGMKQAGASGMECNGWGQGELDGSGGAEWNDGRNGMGD
jgi:hypothetical protein